MPWSRFLRTAVALALVLAGASGIVPARAADEGRAGATPPRLGFIDGDVSYWRPGAEDWAPAQVNTAVAAGDSLYAGDGANLELQIGSRAFVRAGSNTQIGLESLEPQYMQFKVTGGHMALDLTRLPGDQTIEIDTPNAAFTVDRKGYYRVDVDDDGNTTFAARRGGAATVVPANGETAEVGDNQQVVVEGSDTPRLSTNAAPEPDEWDRWNFDRTGQLGERPRSAEYAPDVAGVDDLDRYGDWRETPRYGHVWVPHEVAPDWTPYSTGRWVWDPYYGWTWVDYAPWGWAPYHYGRWVYADNYWGWAPGPVVAVAPPVFSPALVAFFGAPGIGVSVSVGFPFVSWVALGFGEPCIPWWGPVGFVGVPFWGGWHGPHIVNNVVISNTTIVNVRNINKFQNVNVHNAVVAVRRDQFARGQVDHVRLSPTDVRRLEPIRGRPGVNPAREALVAKEGKGRRPPERLLARSVVATRSPQSPVGRLRAAGLRDVSAPRAPVRVVRPHAGSEPARAPGQPGSVVRRPAGQPPPPPRAARGRADATAGGRAAPPTPPGSAYVHRAPPGAGGRAAVPAPQRPHGGAEGAQAGTHSTPPPPRRTHVERQGNTAATAPPHGPNRAAGEVHGRPMPPRHEATPGDVHGRSVTPHREAQPAPRRAPAPVPNGGMRSAPAPTRAPVGRAPRGTPHAPSEHGRPAPEQHSYAPAARPATVARPGAPPRSAFAGPRPTFGGGARPSSAGGIARARPTPRPAFRAGPSVQRHRAEGGRTTGRPRG